MSKPFLKRKNNDVSFHWTPEELDYLAYRLNIPDNTAAEYAIRQRTVCITGERPEQLCGFDRDCYHSTIERMKDHIRRLYELGYRVFLTNNQQGIAQLAFWAVHHVKIDDDHPDIVNCVFRPFHSMAGRWEPESAFGQRDFALIGKHADILHYVTNTRPFNKADANSRFITCADAMAQTTSILLFYQEKDTASPMDITAKQLLSKAKTNNIPVFPCNYQLAQDRLIFDRTNLFNTVIPI